MTHRPDGSVPRHLCAAIVTALDASLPVQTTEDDRRALRINEHVGFQKLHQYDAWAEACASMQTDGMCEKPRHVRISRSTIIPGGPVVSSYNVIIGVLWSITEVHSSLKSSGMPGIAGRREVRVHRDISPSQCTRNRPGRRCEFETLHRVPRPRTPCGDHDSQGQIAIVIR